MSYCADKLGVDAHTRTHKQTDAGNDNTRRPKLASGKNAIDVHRSASEDSSKNKEKVWTPFAISGTDSFVNTAWLILMQTAHNFLFDKTWIGDFGDTSELWDFDDTSEK